MEDALLMANSRHLRDIALPLEGTAEAAHFDRVAFRVTRIYATLASDGLTANLKFRPDEQELKCLVAPDVYSPVPNSWGRQGWTTVTLAKLSAGELRNALETAWCHALPAKRQTAKSRDEHLQRALELMRVVARELDLPGLEESIWLGRASLRVRGKSIMGSKNGKELAVLCAIEEKELLMEAAPEIYFETSHYKGYRKSRSYD
jgi:hypothetical protein